MDNSSGDPAIAFGHLQRDPTVANSLNQALGSHIRSAFHDGAFRLTDSPPTILDSNAAPPRVPGPRSPIHDFAVPLANDPPAPNTLKRKHPEAAIPSGQLPKRRRDNDDATDFDGDSVHGSKHWTDDEKTKLFTWLMDSGEDDHWNALRSTKNSCFRECANQVFGGKKTYQALKGCYERNFNLFKQIFTFEAYSAANGNAPLSMIVEGDRLREYERRLQLARKGGCDSVGNLSARTIDQWHRSGWYSLFYRRWSDDPAISRPSTRQNTNGVLGSGTNSNDIEDDENSSDMPDPPLSALPQSARTPPYSLPLNPKPSLGLDHQNIEAGPSGSPSRPRVSAQKLPSPQPEQSHIHFSVPQNLMAACLQLLQAQVQHSKLKIEYLRKREEREEKESTARQELERRRFQQAEPGMKERAEVAMSILGSPTSEACVRQAAVDYLRSILATDRD